MTKLGSRWEILSDERNKLWINKKTFTVIAPCGEVLTVPAGYIHDRATIAPDCNDNDPFIAHDYAYDINGSERVWNTGTPIRRYDADKLMYQMMKVSRDPLCQMRADQYYNRVRQFGWIVWYTGSIRQWWRNFTSRRRAIRFGR